MQSLDEKTWDAVELDSMFTFERGKEKNMASLAQGYIPLVSARKVNNGIKGFIDEPAKVIKGGNVISLNNDGDGGAGLAYYQPVDFALDTHVTALHPKEDISPDALICMTASISKQHAVFGHGRSISLPRAHRILNMLPVTDSGKPDYEYMAEYTRQKREALLSKYRTYVEKCIEEIGEPVEIPALNEKEWSHFKMPEIFEMIQRGKRLKTADHVAGMIPYVSSTANNNGVDDYIEATSGTRVFGDCISLANSGSVGTAFYEPFDFVASDHVTALKTEGMSKYCYLFMTALIEKQGSNFNFNREINDARIKNMQVMLPVDDSGEPDYEYMEQYSRNMMLKKYKLYLAYMGRKGGQPVE